MNLFPSTRRHLAWLIQVVTITIAAWLAAAPTQAYVLMRTGSCPPGARWSTSVPVKVQWLSESFTAYITANRIPDGLIALTRMIGDIQAVIDEYNVVRGSALKLEYAGGIPGDSNLDPYPDDSFNAQTIVIGFSTGSSDSDESAPAWTPSYPEGACTITRAHVFFKRDKIWTFGPPPSTDVTGKKFGGGLSFRAVLLHEMGHAVGLAHETDAYAVMDQGTKAWTRGAGEVPQMELLPDDTLGLLKLYGLGAGLQGFDVSLTNTSFQTADQLTQLNFANDKRHPGCGNIETVLAGLQAEQGQVLAALDSLQGHDLAAAQKRLSHIRANIAAQEAALWECRYREKTAQQVEQCRVSSRGDSYAPQSDGTQPFCGVNAPGSSAHPTVDNEVCPGDDVQVRYTANNKSAQDVKLEEMLWFSADDTLQISGAETDYRSLDQREFLLAAGRSASLERVFRVPAGIHAGTYKVFVYVYPHDPSSGDLIGDDGQGADSRNDALRLHGTITVRSRADCS